jgi:hypothetical protein
VSDQKLTTEFPTAERLLRGTGATMIRDRAHAVTGVIVELINTARGDEPWQRIEDLLREEFHDERRQGVADRGDDDL